MRKNWGLIGALVLVLLVAWFAVINSDPVQINFGFVTVDWPLSIVILGSLLIGALIAVFVASATAYSRHREVKRNEERLQAKKDNSENTDEIEQEKTPKTRSERSKHDWD